MFDCIEQPRTSSFPIRLVKTESDFIVRSVETRLGRWMLVLMFIIFFCFLIPDLSPWGYGYSCFLVALCCLIVRRPKLQVAAKRLLHQQVKILGWIFWRSLDVICYDRWVLREGHTNYFKDWCLMTSQPTFLFLTYFNLMNYGHIIKRM